MTGLTSADSLDEPLSDLIDRLARVSHVDDHVFDLALRYIHQFDAIVVEESRATQPFSALVLDRVKLEGAVGQVAATAARCSNVG